MAKTVRHDNALNAYWGDEDHLQVAQQRTFAQMIFELLSEQASTPEQSQLFELILNISIDHGEATPSAIATLEKASQGATISDSVAAGITQITDTHGGAIEPAMRFFYLVTKDGMDMRALVKEYLDNKKLIGGFGHRIYQVDPRAQLLLSKLEEFGMGSEYISLIKGIEAELQIIKQRHLPVNVDGAIAAVLCSFGWDPAVGKAVFIIARTPGLCGQFLNHGKE